MIYVDAIHKKLRRGRGKILIRKLSACGKAYSVGDYKLVFQKVIPPKDTKKLAVHQEGSFYRLSTSRVVHLEKIKRHNPST